MVAENKPKVDTMTIDLAESGYPKIIIMAPSGSLDYVMGYVENGLFDQVYVLSDSVCPKIDCNAVEITIKVQPGFMGYKSELVGLYKASPLKKKHRPVRIEVTIPNKPPMGNQPRIWG